MEICHRRTAAVFFPDYVRARTERVATSPYVMYEHVQNIFTISFLVYVRKRTERLDMRGDSPIATLGAKTSVP